MTDELQDTMTQSDEYILQNRALCSAFLSVSSGTDTVVKKHSTFYSNVPNKKKTKLPCSMIFGCCTNVHVCTVSTVPQDYYGSK